MVGAEHDQRHRPERRGGEQLVEAPVGVELLDLGIELQGLGHVPGQQHELDRPLLRGLGFPKPFRERVDQHHAGDLIRPGPRKEAGDDAAVGMRHQHDRGVDPGGADQRVEIGGRVARRGRLRHRIAAARRLAHRRSRPVVGADPCEGGDRVEDVGRARRGLGPVGRRRLPAGDDNDGRGSRPTAFDVHLTAIVDVDGPGKVGGRRARRNGSKEGGEAKPGDGHSALLFRRVPQLARKRTESAHESPPSVGNHSSSVMALMPNSICTI
jgi:hypothetical protein